MKEFKLFILALVLSIILFPIGIIYSFIKISITTKEKVFFRFALAIDQIGNTVLEHLFNDFLITNNGYRFGDSRETISKVIGLNKINGTLSKYGILLYTILNTIDENHCEKAAGLI